MQIGTPHILGLAAVSVLAGAGIAAVTESRDETAVTTMAGVIGGGGMVASIGAWHLFGAGATAGMVGVAGLGAMAGSMLVDELNG